MSDAVDVGGVESSFRLNITQFLRSLDQAEREYRDTAKAASGTAAANRDAGKSFEQAGASAAIAGSRLGRFAQNFTSTNALIAGAAGFLGGTLASMALQVGNSVRQAVSEIARLPEQTLTVVNALNETSASLGVSAQDLARWGYVIEATGGTAESLRSALRVLSNAASENSDEFRRLGIDVHDGNGKLKDTSELLREVLAGLQDLDSPTQRLATGSQLLGRGFLEMGTIASMTMDQVDALIRQFDELGGTPSQRLLALATQLDDIRDRNKALTTGLKNDWTETTAPALIGWRGMLNDILELYRSISHQRPPPAPLSGAPGNGRLPGLPPLPAPGTIPTGQVPSISVVGPGQPVPVPDVVLPGSYAWYAMERAQKEAEAARDAEFARRFEADRASRGAASVGPGSFGFREETPTLESPAGPSAAEIEKGLKDLDEKMRTPWENAIASVRQFEDVATAVVSTVSDAAAGLGSVFGVTITEGIRAGGRAFASFARQFLAKIASMIAQAVIFAAVMSFAGFGSFGSLFRGSLGFPAGAGAAAGALGDFPAEVGGTMAADNPLVDQRIRGEGSRIIDLLLQGVGSRLDSRVASAVPSSPAGPASLRPTVKIYEASERTYAEVWDRHYEPRMRERARRATVAT